MPRKQKSSGRKKTSPAANPGRSTAKRRAKKHAVQPSAEHPSPPQPEVLPNPQAVRSGATSNVAALQSSADADDPALIVREAHRDDIPELEQFVERFVQANRLLPRTTDELYDLVPFGFVAYADGRLVGFAALEIYSAKLAEIRSLAVHEDYQGRGIGKQLVLKCVDLAHMRNILEVMAITSSDGFFKACGFDFTLPGEKKALFMQTRDEY